MAAAKMQKVVETPEFAAFSRRILKALARRIGDQGDIVVLHELAEMERCVQAMMLEAVDKLKADPWNYSWADVALELGTNRSAAHERFGPKSIYRQRAESAKAAGWMEYQDAKEQEVKDRQAAWLEAQPESPRCDWCHCLHFPGDPGFEGCEANLAETFQPEKHR